MLNSEYVCTVRIFTKPDMMEELEVRRVEGGVLVGLDGAYLEQMSEEEQPRSPYDGKLFKVPDDECATPLAQGDVNLWYKVQQDPLTLDEIKKLIDDDNWLTGVVEVDWTDLHGINQEGINELLTEKLIAEEACPYKLQDLSFKLVGSQGQYLHVEVTGDATELFSEDE